MKNGEFSLTAQQIGRIVDAGASIRDRVLMRVLAETGMRRAEVAALDIEDVWSSERLIRVRRGKGGKSRMVPMTAALARSLQGVRARRSAGPVFRSRTGGRISPRQVNRVVARAGQKACVRNPNPRYSNITCHLFRHSFARLWKNNGGSIETLSKILGHASVKTTMDVYGTESLADVRENYARTIGKIAMWNKQ